MSGNHASSVYQMQLQNVAGLLNTSIYSPYVPPMTGSSQWLNVTVFLSVYKILSLTNDGEFTIAAKLLLSWYDFNLPVHSNNSQSIPPLFIRSSLVWTINLHVLNPTSDNMYLQPINLAYITPDGSRGGWVTELIVDEFAAMCKTMNLADFPFDSQSCNLHLQYRDCQSVNFVMPGQLYSFENVGNDEWQVSNISWGEAAFMVTPTGAQGGFAVTFQLTRNSQYYVIFLIVPTALMEALSVLTFVLPTDHGEKVVLGATLVLAMNMLLTSLTSMIPQVQANNVPKLVTALNVGYVMTAVSLVEGVLIQTLRTVADDLPPCMTRLVHRLFTFAGCRKRKPEDFRSLKAFSETSSKKTSHIANGNLRESICQTLNSIDCALRGLLYYHKKKEFKRIMLHEAWRRVEYLLNFVTAIVYCVLLVYYVFFYL